MTMPEPDHVILDSPGALPLNLLGASREPHHLHRGRAFT
jgi:hypothetical protein